MERWEAGGGGFSLGFRARWIEAETLHLKRHRPNLRRDRRSNQPHWPRPGADDRRATGRRHVPARFPDLAPGLSQSVQKGDRAPALDCGAEIPEARYRPLRRDVHESVARNSQRKPTLGGSGSQSAPPHRTNQRLCRAAAPRAYRQGWCPTHPRPAARSGRANIG